MTANEFRRLALSLPEAVEASHLGHPDFRVGGKIFATLGYPDKEWAMVRLPADAQEAFTKIAPDVFIPVKGAWGRQGATNVHLASAKKTMTRDALLAAWRHRAPRKLLK